MLYNFQKNRVIADLQCRYNCVVEKVSTLLQKGKVNCSKEHIRNLKIMKSYMDAIKNYNGFDELIKFSEILTVNKDEQENYRVEITLTLNDLQIVYTGDGTEEEIIDFFKGELDDLNFTTYKRSNNTLVFYSYDFYESSIDLEKLDFYIDDSTVVSLDDYINNMSEVLDELNCLTNCELLEVIDSSYFIINKY